MREEDGGIWLGTPEYVKKYNCYGGIKLYISGHWTLDTGHWTLDTGLQDADDPHTTTTTTAEDFDSTRLWTLGHGDMGTDMGNMGANGAQ
ncbi:GL19356 [Drosophila persimilis]|uniref:GL19356 n=1 Tax=Drosophila persimilis TaxID=7234 RepID=B4G8V3_DROPE|nr:GL19356 [Drosophila persimilis]